jgi:hypothetical protein
MARLIAFLFVVFIAYEGNGQNFASRKKKSIETRNQTAAYIQSKSFEKIKIITDTIYLKYSPYDIDEIEQLLFISASFQRLIQFSKEGGKLTNSWEDKYASIWPNPDSLHKTLYNYLKAHRFEIERQIDEAALLQIDKDYLKLLLLFNILKYDYCASDIETELIRESRQFIMQYKQPEYVVSVNRYFNIEYLTSKWGAGAYFVTGALFPTKDLKDYIPNGIPFNLGISVNYRRLYLIAGFGVGIGGALKQDIFYQKQWQKGDNVLYAMGEVYLGYNLIKTKKIGITPIFGIHGIGLNPSSKSQRGYYDDVENIAPNLPLAFGINFDLKWGYSDCQTKSVYQRGAGRNGQYWMTRLTVGYSTSDYDRLVDGMDGNFIFFKIGIAYQYVMLHKITAYNNGRDWPFVY